MEHLQEDIGGGIATKIQAYCLLNNDNGLPKDRESFCSYPTRCGWVIKDDYTLESSPNQLSLPWGEMLQGWLYFGLIFTVVQEEGRPLLKFDDLVRGRFLCTASLRPALETWFRHETQYPDQLRFKVIQLELILDMARRVVQNTCGYDGVSRQVRYSTKSDELHYLQDECALVLMGVGEALSAVQRRMLEEPGRAVFTSGWISDENPGWGPPRWVFAAMERQYWCPKTIHLLQGQLQSCATLLVAAFSAYDGASRMIKGHMEAGCTAEQCLLRVAGGGMWYHETNCDLQSDCGLVGPDMGRVVDIIQSPDLVCIPLVEFQDDTLQPKVIAFNPLRDKTQYFVISHVWTDGWGNERENKLNSCQLNFLKRQVSQAAGGKNVPFWMDTLLIPLWDKYARKKAIGQIHDVFEHAAGTIILDNGLLETSPGSPIQAAMRFLASSWMRRLWTMQEGWLSKRLFIPFKEAGKLAQNMTDLNKMRDELEQHDRVSAAIFRMVLDQFRGHFGGQERLLRLLLAGSRRYSSIESQRGAAEAVVAVWRAARWRDISRRVDEVIALATLLDLNLSRVEVSGKAMDIDFVSEMSGLWSKFWMAFQEQYPGGIPGGMIFLPGPKVVNTRGFGWAPLSWMSAVRHFDYPDPLTLWNGPATLYTGAYQTWSGLGVTYPGFLLHMRDSQARKDLVLSMGASMACSATFPVTSYVTEWYSFRPTSLSPSFSRARLIREDSQLAIIVSRPRPRFAPEIGLLVEVCQTIRQRTVSDGLIYCCRIICRIWVHRASVGEDDNKRRNLLDYISKGERGNTVVIGEELASDQAWIVDEFHPKDPLGAFESPEAQQAPQHLEPPEPRTGASLNQLGPSNHSSWLPGTKKRKLFT